MKLLSVLISLLLCVGAVAQSDSAKIRWDKYNKTYLDVKGPNDTCWIDGVPHVSMKGIVWHYSLIRVQPRYSNVWVDMDRDSVIKIVGDTIAAIRMILRQLILESDKQRELRNSLHAALLPTVKPKTYYYKKKK